MMNNFAVFILTHGRPNSVLTYDTLIRAGYTGKIYIVIDDEDKDQNEYEKKFKNNIIKFNKLEISKTFDIGDNFLEMRGVVYARNASFDIARKLGIQYFLQLDDDYTDFHFRFDQNLNYNPKVAWKIKNFDQVLQYLLNFFIKTNMNVLAISQGGDWIGGSENTKAKTIGTKRKAMNFMIFDVDKPVQFVGRSNEDVNCYITHQHRGAVFLTLYQLSLNQKITQSKEGGMTELYLDQGTYVKSFYSVMYHPSATKINLMGRYDMRIHHRINWESTAPKIIAQKYKL